MYIPDEWLRAGQAKSLCPPWQFVASEIFRQLFFTASSPTYLAIVVGVWMPPLTMMSLRSIVSNKSSLQDPLWIGEGSTKLGYVVAEPRSLVSESRSR